MHRSSWEMEVYASDFQERRQTEAARQRRATEAMVDVSQQGDLLVLGVARFLTAFKSWLATRRIAAPSRGRLVNPAPTTGQPAIASASAGPVRGSKSSRLTAPYADMVVIARGPRGQVVEQPSGVNDC